MSSMTDGSGKDCIVLRGWSTVIHGRENIS